MWPGLQTDEWVYLHPYLDDGDGIVCVEIVILEDFFLNAETFISPGDWKFEDHRCALNRCRYERAGFHTLIDLHQTDWAIN
jgi:hypothetical protein